MRRQDLKAQAILEEFWDMTIPVNPAAFAERLGWRVDERTATNQNAATIDPVTRTIRVDDSLGDVFRRMAIAVALGYIANGDLNALEPTDTQTHFAQRSERRNAEAEFFARSLLMPSLAVKVIVDRRGIKDPAKIREMLGVSSSMLRVRLRELGYLG